MEDDVLDPAEAAAVFAESLGKEFTVLLDWLEPSTVAPTTAGGRVCIALFAAVHDREGGSAIVRRGLYLVSMSLVPGRLLLLRLPHGCRGEAADR